MKKDMIMSADILRIAAKRAPDMPMAKAMGSALIDMTRIEAVLIIDAWKKAGTPKTQAYYRLKRFINAV